MRDLRSVIRKISDLKAKVLKDSISPHYLGCILEEMLFCMSSEPDVEIPVYYSIEFDGAGDGYLAWGESLTVSCRVMQGWHDVTDKVTDWEISRDSGDTAEDAVWNQSEKARTFDGTITLTMTEAENDIPAGMAVFTVRAVVDDTDVAAEILI